MKVSTQPYKGTRDFYPKDQRIQNWIFEKLSQAVSRFGYEPYNGPMLEPFELYAAKTGEEIVNQQLYWMMDRGERKLAVRPEMTPTLARMVAAQFHELPKPIRWFSIPNLWRYERPQRGRLREHWQLNVDLLGGDSFLADVEILQVVIAIMKQFGGEDRVAIRVNHRGLINQYFGNLGLDGHQALQVCKAVDARAKIGEEKYSAWLQQLNLSDEQSRAVEAFFSGDFEWVLKNVPGPSTDVLKRLLSFSGDFEKNVSFDPTIMRGMDYYTGLVFEVYDRSPENPRALFGGGRYDELVSMFGAPKLSGIGFGMGDVGIHNFLDTHGLLPKLDRNLDVFLTVMKAEDAGEIARIAAQLRESGLNVAQSIDVIGLGKQMTLADKLGAKVVLIQGEEERAKGVVALKVLKTGVQIEADESELVSRVRAVL